MLSFILFLALLALPGPIVGVAIAALRGRPKWLVALSLVAVCQIIAIWVFRRYGNWSVACIGEDCTVAKLRFYEIADLGLIFVLGMVVGISLTAAVRAWWVHRSRSGATPA